MKTYFILLAMITTLFISAQEKQEIKYYTYTEETASPFDTYNFKKEYYAILTNNEILTLFVNSHSVKWGISREVICLEEKLYPVGEYHYIREPELNSYIFDIKNGFSMIWQNSLSNQYLFNEITREQFIEADKSSILPPKK